MWFQISKRYANSNIQSLGLVTLFFTIICRIGFWNGTRSTRPQRQNRKITFVKQISLQTVVRVWVCVCVKENKKKRILFICGEIGFDLRKFTELMGKPCCWLGTIWQPPWPVACPFITTSVNHVMRCDAAASPGADDVTRCQRLSGNRRLRSEQNSRKLSQNLATPPLYFNGGLAKLGLKSSLT